MAGNFEYTLTPQGQALRDQYSTPARMSSGGAYNFDLNGLKGSGRTQVFGNGMDQVAAGSTPMGEDNYIPLTGAHGEPLQAQKAGDNWIVYPMLDMGGTLFSGQKLTKLNGVPYDVYGPDGAHIDTKKFEGFKDDKIGDALGVASIIAMAGGAAAAGLGAAGAGTGAAAGAAEGAAGAGWGGFLGDTTAAGYAGLDAASTATLGGGASGAWGGGLTAAGAGGGALTGLNAVDLTGTGLPLDSAGSVVGSQAGGGTLSNAAIEQMIQGAGLTTQQVLSTPSLLSQLASKLGTTPSSLTSLLGPAASIVSGGLAAGAAGDAADSQLQAQREAAALSEPWRQKGEVALNRMAQVIGIGGDTGAADYNSLNKPYTADSLYSDPSYQFRKDEGMNGLTRAYAGKGNFLSGGTARALERYGSDYASTEFGKGFERDRATKSDSFNRLASIAGTGQTAATTMGGYASNAGDAAAAGTMGTANAWQDAISGAYRNYQANQQNAMMQPFYDAITKRMLPP